MNNIEVKDSPFRESIRKRFICLEVHRYAPELNALILKGTSNKRYIKFKVPYITDVEDAIDKYMKEAQ